MVVLAVFIGLLLYPFAASASDETAKSEQPTLTVTGTGHLALAPDTAFVTLGVETAAKSVADAQRMNQTVMSKIIARLRELQIEPERIQTASFTVSPQYKPPRKHSAEAPSAPPEIIGYVVSNSVTVEVRNLEKVAGVIEESLEAGANQFHGLHWGVRDEQPAKLVALKQAATKAREKAAALSEALKVKLTRLVGASEGVQLVRPVPQAPRMMAMESGGGQPPIFSGELKVEAAVTLIYAIGQE